MKKVKTPEELSYSDMKYKVGVVYNKGNFTDGEVQYIDCIDVNRTTDGYIIKLAIEVGGKHMFIPFTSILNITVTPIIHPNEALEAETQEVEEEVK